MFTLERAAQIFPETRTADVVPAITARFQLLSAEDQLALIWYAYLEMGSTITVAAPAAARMQFAERTLQEIKAMTFAEQSQVMCDLANRADTPISRVYATWSVNIKLGFWYQLGEWMAAGSVAPIPEGYQLSANASAVLSSKETTRAIPAFGTTMSTPPNVLIVSSTSRCRSAGRVTSPPTACTFPGCRVARTCSSSRLRANATTLAPSPT